MVLAPTAGPSGAYVFTMSFFAVDFAKNSSTKVESVRARRDRNIIMFEWPRHP